MKISELIKQPENRRLEFKEKLPSSQELAKTIIAFANDAGGDLIIGIQDKPREIIGINEDELLSLEEKISNIIYEHCQPVIIPDISFHSFDKGSGFIKVHIHRGSQLPYYLKSKGKLEGTYIRVGSSTRKADSEIIAELERQKRNVSFDSEIVHDKKLKEIDLKAFSNFFKEKTKEHLSQIILQKLELIKIYQNSLLPTNAYILFSDGKIKNELFPYAKIECARFKGTNTDIFIDQKTIDGNIAIQAEAAYEFILRHINQGASINGIYTESRWEYPVAAIREVIRNAVVHRDYSLTGKDIKVAIYDDMVEITSPGLLMPSIDFNELEARQSDIRNKVIAPVFKRLGIIDQWGNGLKLIADEIQNYPEIEFKWLEKGIQFQVQFLKRTNSTISASGKSELRENLGLSWEQVGTKLGLSREQVELILNTCKKPAEIKDLMNLLELHNRTKFRNKYIKPLLGEKLLVMTEPNKPTSSKQKYYTTEKGKSFLEQNGKN